MNNSKNSTSSTVDAIIQRNSQILFVKRKKEPFKGMLTFPGGFVNDNEKVEDTVIREVKEETSLSIKPIDILGVYSDPNRDPRGHIISTVFIVEISDNNFEATAKDDAEDIKWIDIDKTDNENFGFDHKKIILDYKKWKQSKGTFWSTR